MGRPGTAPPRASRSPPRSGRTNPPPTPRTSEGEAVVTFSGPILSPRAAAAATSPTRLLSGADEVPPTMAEVLDARLRFAEMEERLEVQARPRTWCAPTPCTFPSVHC